VMHFLRMLLNIPDHDGDHLGACGMLRLAFIVGRKANPTDDTDAFPLLIRPHR
jgi:hypothetical protein